MTTLGTILGVWAHPDDETYLSAGVMAAARRNGQRVVCVTATRGEAGSQDHERWPPDTIGEVREQELMEALGILGVTEHHWLDYRDGECESVDFEEAVGKIAALIAEIEPDSVLTFDRTGQTLHPDHIAVHRWATEAFQRAAPRGSRLYQTAVTQEWIDEFGPALEPYNVFAPGSPSVVPRDELAIYENLSDDLHGVKLDALRAQVSQTEGLISVLGPDFYMRGLKLESFFLVAEKT